MFTRQYLDLIIIIDKSVFFILLSWFILFIMFTLEELNKIYDCLDEYESNLYNGNWDAIKKEVALIKKIQFMLLTEITRLEEIIKKNTIKEDKPNIKEVIKEDTLYKLTSGSQEKRIVNGDSFKDSEVK